VKKPPITWRRATITIPAGTITGRCFDHEARRVLVEKTVRAKIIADVDARIHKKADVGRQWLFYWDGYDYYVDSQAVTENEP
jgi:hypothetical protein